MHPPQTRKHHAFTLVELLVVIGIIALLISMLMPALNKMRAQAMRTKCQAQMRDVGLALMVYSNTYRGWLFPVGEFRVSNKIPRLPPPKLPAGIPDPDCDPYTAIERPLEVPADQASGWAAAAPAPAMVNVASNPVPQAAAASTQNSDPGFFETLGVEPDWDKAFTSPPYNPKGQYYRGRFLRWPNYVFDPPRWNPQILICPADIEPAEQHSFILNRHLASRMDKVVKLGGRVPNRTPSEVLLMGEKKTVVEDYYMGAKESNGTQSEFDIVEPYRHGLKLGSNYLYMDGHVEILSPQAVEKAMDAWDVDLLGN